jgi:hypothetical protein
VGSVIEGTVKNVKMPSERRQAVNVCGSSHVPDNFLDRYFFAIKVVSLILEKIHLNPPIGKLFQTVLSGQRGLGSPFFPHPEMRMPIKRRRKIYSIAVLFIAFSSKLS